MSYGIAKYKDVDVDATHEMMAEAWKVLNKIRKQKFSNEAWAECYKDSLELGKDNRLYQKIVIALHDEIEYEQYHPAEAKVAYTNAAKSYQDAFTFLKELMSCEEMFDMEGIVIYADFLHHHKDKFARSLAAAIYEAVCRHMSQTTNTSLVQKLTDFYDLYKEDVSAEAFVDASRFLEIHPEYTPQMTALLSYMRSTQEKALSAA